MKLKFFTILGISLLLFTTASSPLAVFAANANSNNKSGTPEVKELEPSGIAPDSYSAATVLRTGTVVQPDGGKDSTKVKAATQDKIEAAFGVVVTTNNLPISITTTGGSGGQVYISTSGRHDALVTSENGPIKSGDFLAISSLSGTLTKSNEKPKYVFGKALASFDGKNNLVATKTLNDTKGKPIKKIGIGLIPIAIEIQKNPETKSTKSKLPQMLQRIGQAIAEKPVSAIRVYISTAIVTFSIVLALTLLYVGVRSAIIAIGRNPLSKKSIFRALLEVVLTSVLVLIIGLFTVYLILRL
jgi:hypothetical protein